MPGITKEQIKKHNEKLSNGWRFDPYFYVTWGEKIARRIITKDEKHYLQFTLRYFPLNKEVTNDFGQKFSVPSGKYILTLVCCEYTQINPKDLFVSSGTGKHFTFDKPCNSRVFSGIAKKTIDLTEQELLGYWVSNEEPDIFMEEKYVI